MSLILQGMVRRNNHLKMARYHQHLHELLEMDLSPLDYMMKMFPEFKEREQMRKVRAHFPVLRSTKTKKLSVLFLPILILTIIGETLSLRIKA
jgi:ATPase subunit of ABC transporter with duplicated ATPase domains